MHLYEVCMYTYFVHTAVSFPRQSVARNDHFYRLTTCRFDFFVQNVQCYILYSIYFGLIALTGLLCSCSVLAVFPTPFLPSLPSFYCTPSHRFNTRAFQPQRLSVGLAQAHLRIHVSAHSVSTARDNHARATPSAAKRNKLWLALGGSSDPNAGPIRLRPLKAHPCPRVSSVTCSCPCSREGSILPDPSQATSRPPTSRKPSLFPCLCLPSRQHGSTGR
jgi:hypothetical protein